MSRFRTTLKCVPGCLTDDKSSLLRTDSRLVPSQRETSLQSKAVSHWLGANLESFGNDLAPNSVKEMKVIFIYEAIMLSSPITTAVVTTIICDVKCVENVHDDVIKWKHFPRYWPFVPGIHRGQWRRALMFFFYPRLNKRLSKQSWGWWFETPLCPLWRHCNMVSWQLSVLPQTHPVKIG